MHLPKDTPKAAFHASAKEGDLGIMSFQTSIPALMKQRFDNILKNSGSDAAVVASEQAVRSATVPPKFWANQLHTIVDGKGLKEAHLSPPSHNWLDSGTKLMRGAAYIQACKIRLSVITTLARSARGQDADRNRKLGCAVPRTAHHIMQVCHGE